MPVPGFLDLESIQSLLDDPRKRRLLMIAAAAVGLAIVLAVWRWAMQWMRRPAPVTLTDASLVIDLSSLPIGDPHSSRLTVYHIPVRLAVVVIAPLGREANPPTHSQVPELLNQLVPNLASVMGHDETIVKIWPRQLSATGFGPTLLRHLQLPGGRGQGTPWCLVSGRTTFAAASYAIGLALAASSVNNLGIVSVESEHQWLDVLRLRADNP
jgi:hypothetical protein